MSSNTIQIEQGADKKVSLRFKHPIGLSEALQLYFTGALALLKSFTPPDDQDAKGEIYDMFNVGASHVLDVYAPEIAIRPDLTTESIFDAELNLLSDKYGIPKDAVQKYAAKTYRAIINQNKKEVD